jgi:hypothetical protein
MPTPSTAGDEATTTARLPSAPYFTVDTRDGEPVPGLTAEQLRIDEDDQLVSPYESKQTILNSEVAARHSTLLLLDMSGSVTAIDAVDFDVFVIGVGADIDEDALRALSKSGAALSKDPSSVGAWFDAVARRIEGFSKRFYLLSYCSPARAGQHRLPIGPFTPDGKKGRLEYVFDADGFGPECDPNRKPAFDVRRPKLDGVRR